MKKLAVIAAAAALTVGGGAMSVWSASTPPPDPSAATTPATAGSPDSTRAPAQDERRDDARPMRNPPRQWSRETGFMLRPISREEWDAVDWFMNRFTPIRWQKFNEMPEDKHRERLRTIIANRYRAMQQLKVNDIDTFQLRVRRLKIEDRIFDLGWRVNHNGEPPTTQPLVPPDQPASTQAVSEFANMTADQLRDELRKQVRELIANRIEERRLHVKQLKERLNTETARLDEEQASVDRLVEAGMKSIREQRWPGIGGELVPPMPSAGGGGASHPRQQPQQNPEEAREPAPTIAPAEASEQQ